MHYIKLKRVGKKVETHVSKGVTGDVLNVFRARFPDFHKDFRKSDKSEEIVRFSIDYKNHLTVEGKNQEQ